MLVDATTGSPYTACQQWGQAALNDLVTKIKPNVVITSGLPEDGTVGHPAPGPAAFEAIGAGMAQYWTDLENHGIAVVAIKETPLMNFPEPDCIAKYGRTSSKCTVPTAKAVPADPPTIRASRRTPAARCKVINMDNFICGPTECEPVVGNVLVYLDGRHLTAAYAPDPDQVPGAATAEGRAAARQVGGAGSVRREAGQDVEVGGPGTG